MALTPREIGNRIEVQPVRVVTVDDQALFRDVARALIEATAGFETVGEAASGEEALQLCEELRPDLVLLDINLPGIDGLETSRRLSARRDAPVIVLTSADSDPALHEVATQLGASVFVSKAALSARALREVWNSHGAHAPAG